MTFIQSSSNIENQPIELDAGDLARSLVSDAVKPVSKELECLEPKLMEYSHCPEGTSRDILEHVFYAGGKRIRPALYFFCARLCHYQGDHLYPVAAVCEYVHTASLLHDDVVDNSSLRRNKPTSNSIWGDQASVLVGDLIYSRASELMALTGSLEIVETFASAIRLMSAGELLQLEQNFTITDASEQAYFRILTAKTAKLISASCKAPAILAGASRETVDALDTFGSSLGLAFQLVDDALDYLGEDGVVGKSTLADFREGKMTYPVLLLNSLATDNELEEMAAAMNQRPISEEGVRLVAGLVEKYQTAEKTIELAHKYTDDAVCALGIFPESPAKDSLERIAYSLVGRIN